MNRYNPNEIEPKWQKIWADDGRYHAPDQSDKPKYYVTGMFPYPSGAGMHTGHFFEHSIVDGVARFRRALGYNVMYPMGWDSFGLPAENYAIKTGKAPAVTTLENIANFKNQLTRVGASIDWTRELNTTDPEYYKWTQWIFTQLFERGLAYQKEANQWWCPVDKTVLANEQVEGGKCWRCGNEVIKKSMKQWFFKITDYADALLDEIPALDWPDKIKTAQENWIGRSEGAEIRFTVDLETADSLKFTPELAQSIIAGEKNSTIRLEPKSVQVGEYLDAFVRDGDTVTPFGKLKIVNDRRMPLGDISNELDGHAPYASDDEKLQDYKGYYGDHVTLDTEFVIYDFEYIPDITVFSTRPDTLFGASFLVLAPEHPLARRLASDDTREAVNAYIDQSLKKSEIERQSEGKEKTGVFTGAHAINPASGERMQIWVADYVLGGYGTGAVMGVPAHDERDFAFAEKFKLPIINVINPESVRQDAVDREVDVVKDKIVAVVMDDAGRLLTINWGDKGGRLFVGGTVEGDESPETTALREVTEETGYDDLEVLYVADESYHYKYFAHSKQETHETNVRFVLMKLKSDHQVAQNLDESEKGNFTVEWVSESAAGVEIVEPLHRHGYDRLVKKLCYHGEGTLTNSGQFDGMSTSDAREQIVAWLEQEGRGGAKITYKMRDWLISRQRYWGAPIPIIHCPDHGAVVVPEKDLPVLLPEVEDFAPRGDGKSVLAASEDWVNTICPTCGESAKRETDTMDGYACSSWYLLRYTDPHDAEQAWDPQLAKYWTPIDMYVGGDHAVAHLLYVRFWSHVFYDMQLVPGKEPVKKLVYHGLIQAEDGRKMSKSLGNVVDPLEVIDAGYGADALRTFELFLGPINENSNWSSKGIAGVYRFLNRLWTLVQEYQETAIQPSATQERLRSGSQSEHTSSETRAADVPLQPKVVSLEATTHATIKKVTDDVHRLSFNTAIAAMMECVNELYKLKVDGFSDEWQESLEALVKLVQPFAPHMAAELWQQLGHDTQLDFEPWPQWDEAKIVTDTITVIVQVNGKLRAKLTVAPDAAEQEIKNLALADENVQKFVTGEPRKVIYIPGKLVSIVA